MKYITIDSLGKRRFVFDEEAAQKAMDEGKIVVDDKFNILNPIILTSDNGLQLKSKGLGLTTISLKEFLRKP